MNFNKKHIFDPYGLSPSIKKEEEDATAIDRRFSYFLFGVLPGLIVGPTYFITSSLVRWMHGEVWGISTKSIFLYMALFSLFSGAVGLIYAGFMAIIAYQANFCYRLIVHQFGSFAICVAISAVCTEMNFSYDQFISPITGGGIVYCLMGVLALTTADKTKYYRLVPSAKRKVDLRDPEDIWGSESRKSTDSPKSNDL